LKIEGWRARLLIAFGYRLIQLWVRTLRLELEDRGGVVPAGIDQPFIFAVWHNRLLLLPSVFRRFLSERSAAALISASGTWPKSSPLERTSSLRRTDRAAPFMSWARVLSFWRKNVTRPWFRRAWNTRVAGV
jgi:hypothetical protein